MSTLLNQTIVCGSVRAEEPVSQTNTLWSTPPKKESHTIPHKKARYSNFFSAQSSRSEASKSNSIDTLFRGEDARLSSMSTPPRGRKTGQPRHLDALPFCEKGHASQSSARAESPSRSIGFFNVVDPSAHDTKSMIQPKTPTRSPSSSGKDG